MVLLRVEEYFAGGKLIAVRFAGDEHRSRFRLLLVAKGVQNTVDGPAGCDHTHSNCCEYR
jgi:hypothetical protein